MLVERLFEILQSVEINIKGEKKMDKKTNLQRNTPIHMIFQKIDIWIGIIHFVCNCK